MKKLILITLVLVLVLGGVIGCSSATTTVTNTVTTTAKTTVTAAGTTTSGASSTATAAGPTINVKYSTWAGAATVMSSVLDKTYMSKIEQATNGQVKFTYFSDMALGTSQEHMELVETGACDIGFLAFSTLTGQFALTKEFTLPGTWPSAAIGAQVAWEAYEKGLLEKDYGTRCKLLSFIITGPQGLHYVSPNPPHNLAEMKGIKVYAPGGVTGDAIAAMGMIPNYLPPAEVYSALEKGLLEGARFSFEGVVNYKWVEVLKSHLLLTVDNSVWGYVANIDFWNKLPDNVKAVFEDVMGGAAATQAATAIIQSGDTTAFNSAATQGMLGTLYNPTPAEKAEILGAVKPVVDKYLADEDAKGNKATELYQFLISRGNELLSGAGH